MWSDTPLARKLGLALPIFQSPMAGAAAPELGIAVSEAGGLGALSVAMATPQQIAEQVALFRERSSRPFNLNLFAYEPQTASEAAIARLHALLAPIRKELGIPEPQGPLSAPPDLDAQYRAAIDANPPVFSFTFGIPRREYLDELRRRGAFIIGTATHLEEALALEQIGVDAICAQGAEAGGHRGTFIGAAEDALIRTFALVPMIAARVSVPVIAAGGIMSGPSIAWVLAHGAQAVQLGTAFLACPECMLQPLHLEALRSPQSRRTRVTRAFSGRAARGIANRMMELLDESPDALLPYPLQGAAIRDIRAAANAQGRWEFQQLWAGQGAPAVRSMGASELMRTLAQEANAASARLGAPPHS